MGYFEPKVVPRPHFYKTSTSSCQHSYISKIHILIFKAALHINSLWYCKSLGGYIFGEFGSKSNRNFIFPDDSHPWNRELNASKPTMNHPLNRRLQRKGNANLHSGIQHSVVVNSFSLALFLVIDTLEGWINKNTRFHTGLDPASSRRKSISSALK